MGSRGVSRNTYTYSSSEQRIIDDLSGRKREKLVIYDDAGNIIHTEGGTKGHTGYSNNDYQKEGMNAIHNHPKGYAPYPSNTDLATFYRDKYKSMSIVSDDYIVTIKQDEKYKKGILNYGDISGTLQYARGNLPHPEIDGKSFHYLQTEKGMDVKTYNQYKRENEFATLMEAGRREGYKVIITDRRTNKQRINKPFK